MKNGKNILLIIETNADLMLILKTPALRNLFHEKQLNTLNVGVNEIVVNNYVYSKLKNSSIFKIK